MNRTGNLRIYSIESGLACSWDTDYGPWAGTAIMDEADRQIFIANDIIFWGVRRSTFPNTHRSRISKSSR